MHFPAEHPMRRVGEYALIGFGIFTTIVFIQSEKVPELELTAPMTLMFASMPVVNALILFLKNRKQKLLDATLTINPKGISSRTYIGTESETDWKAVLSITRKAGATAIQISKKPDIYFWIPNERFASPADADRFYSTAKDYWENLRFPQALETEAEKEKAPVTYSQTVHADIKLKELIKFDYFFAKHFVALGLLMAVLITIQQLFYPANALNLIFQCLITLFFFLLPGAIAKRKYKEHPDWMDAQISINSEFLNSNGVQSGFDNRFVWKNVKRIFRLPGAICYSLDSGWSICIPTRCFPSSQSADEFFQLSTQYWNDAKQLQGIEQR